MPASATDIPPEITVPPITTREIRAAEPRRDAESLRAAYLELLKLCLCDLAGDGTMSVTWKMRDDIQ